MIFPDLRTALISVSIIVIVIVIISSSKLMATVTATATGNTVLPYSLAECPNTINVNASELIFVVYVKVIDAPDNGLLRIGIPGREGYRCQFHDQTLLPYGFKEGEINVHDEYYVCIDDRNTGNMNCETHRFMSEKNPETVNLTMKHISPDK